MRKEKQKVGKMNNSALLVIKRGHFSQTLDSLLLFLAPALIFLAIHFTSVRDRLLPRKKEKWD